MYALLYGKFVHWEFVYIAPSLLYFSQCLTRAESSSTVFGAPLKVFAAVVWNTSQNHYLNIFLLSVKTV